MAGRPINFRTLVRYLLIYVPPIALYYALLAGYVEAYPRVWFPLFGLSAAAYFGAWHHGRSAGMRWSLVYFSGLLIAGFVEFAGYRWLHMAYLPYVMAVGVMLGGRDLALALLLVPLFEAGHTFDVMGAFTNGFVFEEVYEEFALFGFSALTAAMVHIARTRHQSASAAVALAPDGSPEEEAPVDSPAVKEKISSLLELEIEPDPEVRDILKAAALTLRPSAVNLFQMAEGELALRSSSDWSLKQEGEGLIGRAAELKQSILSARMEDEGQVAGYRRAAEVSSLIAAPVLDGSVVLGVLAVDHVLPGAFSEQDRVVLEVYASQVARALARDRVHAIREQDSIWLRVIHEESSRLLGSLDLGEIVRLAAGGIGRIAPMHVSFLLAGERGFRLVYKNGMVPAEDITFSLKGTLAEMAVTEGEQKYVSNLRGYRIPVLPIDDRENASSLMIPLRYEGDTLGVVVLASERVDPLSPRQIDALGVLANQTSVAIKNAMFHAEIKRRALTDGLTGLTNRRHFMERLEHEFKLFKRTGQGFALLIADIDFFKKVNDTYGHPAGDAVLVDVARVLRAAIREVDEPARFGGEEFAAILADTGTEGAYKTAERIRAEISRARVETGGTAVSVTASIGIAACPEHADDVGALIDLADKALYRAKQEGRNRVIRAERIG